MFEHEVMLGDSDTTLEELESYESFKDKVVGVLLGAAVADALGWSTEFIKTKTLLQRLFSLEEVEGFLPWEKKTGGRFNTYIDYIQPGEYSDDTQLTLSSARSINADGSFNGDHFAKAELPVWLSYARGAGATVTRAARAISRQRVSWNTNFFNYESRGRKSRYIDAGANGAAMRVAPFALANRDDETRAVNATWENAIVTHGHPRAILGAIVYVKALHLLIAEQDLDEQQYVKSLNKFIEELNLEMLSTNIHRWMALWSREAGHSFADAFEQTKTEMLELLSNAFQRDIPVNDMYENLGCLHPSTKGSGTGTVAAAIGLFLRYGGNYERAVLKAVNMLGSDTDTIAAMVGGLICARKGQMVIPDKWANSMQDYPYFLRAADAITRISLRVASGNDLVVDHRREDIERDIVSLTQERRAYEGQRVTHPLFGLGWVTKVNSQQIKRRGGGTMLLAKVTFDVGQSCVFRSYQPAKRQTAKT